MSAANETAPTERMRTCDICYHRSADVSGPHDAYGIETYACDDREACEVRSDVLLAELKKKYARRAEVTP